jgi:type IV pilus assembly protein PilV
MTSSPHSFTHGFTLLEVLIAIIVLSFGLLGLAGIQAAGVRNTHSANLRTLAAHQAYDMAERMRANGDGIKAGAYDAIDISTPSDPGCISSGCTAANLAVYDHFAWNTNNSAILPSGRGTVSAIASTTAPNKAYTITVMWDDYRTGVTGTGCGGNPSVDLTCFQVTFRP